MGVKPCVPAGDKSMHYALGPFVHWFLNLLP